MLFHSHLFVFLFLPLVLVGWFGLNQLHHEKMAQGYLVGMSLWFYAHFQPSDLITLAVSIGLGYVLLYLLEKTEGSYRRLILILGCILHLGSLGFFKYTNFFLSNINALAGTQFSSLNLILPLAISFYTFQQLAFLIDCYRNEQTRPSFLDYLLFMLYFPQLLQGPILRGADFLHRIHDTNAHTFAAARFIKGLTRFVLGLSKKVLLADTLGKAVDYGYANLYTLDSLSAFFLMVGYMTQLYLDFSGYCDMAAGIGTMLGLEIVENFDAPFHSASVKEFWRRWHMTLGQFFTRYVYIPLGGSRRGLLRTIVNTLIVFSLSGLWHGASWGFILWGFLHGLGVAYSSLPHMQFILPRRLRQLITYLYVCMTFIFFRAPSIQDGCIVLEKIFTGGWNRSIFKLAENLDIKETYLFTKAISMKLPSLLPWAYLILFAVFLAICALVLCVDTNAHRCGYTTVLDHDKTFPFRPVSVIVLAILFVWSVVSMSGVTTYLYFNF